MSDSTPSLNIHISYWSLLDEAGIETEAGVRTHLEKIKEAGFNSYCGSAALPNVKALVEEYGFRYGGAFDAGSVEEFAPKIAANLAVGNGPMNCQLADDDTPVEEAIELTVALMAEAKKQGADVHLEVHRDTCTETPEKTAAIIEGYTKRVGEAPKMNFDFSHPAVVKHLLPQATVERLLTKEFVPVFQNSTLWHIRPFNAQHCQIPITDGKGNFSPEYEACRPFIRAALQCWLEAANPDAELWVVPEQGTTHDYNLSCFPNVWEDTVALGKDVQKIWAELTSN